MGLGKGRSVGLGARVQRWRHRDLLLVRYRLEWRRFVETTNEEWGIGQMGWREVPRGRFNNRPRTRRRPRPRDCRVVQADGLIQALGTFPGAACWQRRPVVPDLFPPVLRPGLATG
jgi:hypothetical protein